ncbi:ferric reductase-like transmembrane domain-containing protein [Spiractinospora alimapuensis]|uniref:ferric reductase-like transmembrane domain-containing protein n=1 Tax=Spiractinospora alimapuensis TaxID=2820884 RepID=UPI001F2D5A84|nr:ferric reductase-like transmembrane domain-containing protein [Spiractinospora alimapuensis]QVQ52230.1 ferric reductase-like transmembrane domain-containing protein [Spiractinospora alimapuensis]
MSSHPSQRQRVRRQQSRVDTRSLRQDLRHLLLDASVAFAVTLAIFVLLYWRVEAGTSQTLMVMPNLDDARRYWLYWACQAFGWSGLLWAWITVLLGLLRSTAPGRWSVVSHARVERWHRVTSLTTIGLMFAHAFAFFLERIRDTGEGDGLGDRMASAFVEVFVPGGYDSGTGQVAILVGLIAFYLAIPLGLSFYVRWWMGARLWRVLHRFVIVVYVLSVWHTLLYGTNVWFDGWFRTVVWALQLPIALVFLVRLLTPLRAEERLPRRRRESGGATGIPVAVLLRLGGRLVVGAAVVVVLLVTVTGRDGGRTPGQETGDMLVTQPMVWGGLAVFLTVLCAVGLAVALARDDRASRTERTRSTERPERTRTAGS